MINVKEILDGYKNYFVGCDSASQELAEQRAEVCASCEFAKKGLHSAILPDYTISEVRGLYCRKCGCPLSAKVRSKTSECPLKKWKKCYTTN